ncbi:glycine oxidase ThiO [Pedococcus sp. NPDC057267]|uniref:glycine oxidase ThiO n=1 Tax=Pedococcus sp. NPDC057267 TaxID=3346077 RepID=UPI00362534B7
MPVTRVAVVGGGVVGLSCAWWLARSGCSVDVVDPAPGQGASHAAAGMLAPLSELVPTEDHVLRFGLHSLQLWPAFGEALEADSGSGIGLRPRGTLLVAHDAGDAEELQRFATLLARDGFEATSLGSRAVRDLEPALSPRVVSGLHLRGEQSVDNRAVVRALMSACARTGARVHRNAGSLALDGDRVVGVRTRSGLVPAEHVVVAAGHRTDEVLATAGLDEGRRLVRSVKGQILRLGGPPGLLRHTVRARVAGEQVYLVPRDSGEVVVGATSEDVGDDTRLTAEGIHRLLQAALTVVPGLADHELSDAVARLRPATLDNGPVIGPTTTPGLLLATGHFRGGVLMAPATAQAVTALVQGATTSPLVEELAPARFGWPAPAAPRYAPTLDQS